MSNDSWNSWAPYSEGKILEIKVSMLEGIIQDLNSVIESLTTELFTNIQKELESGELEGEFKEVLVKELDKLKNKYDASLGNVIMLKFLLERYKKYAEEGPGGILTKTQDYINAHPEAMSKSIKDFREEIEGSVPRIKNDEAVYKQSESKQSELEEEIKRKENHKPEPLDASEEREELATLKSNDAVYRPLDDEVESTFVQVNEELDSIVLNIEILRKELNAYDNLWENYEIDTFDIRSYLAIKRQEIKGIYGLYEKDKIDDISKKVMELLRSWEYGSYFYYEDLITFDGSKFNIDCQVPYDVGDGMATIEPGIAVKQNGDRETSLNQKVANGLGTNINSILVGEDGACIPRATLDKAAERLMNNEFIPHILGGVDRYNEVTNSSLELSQIHLDAIASLYWNTGSNILYYKDHGTGEGDYFEVTGIEDVGEIEFLQDKTVEFYGNINNANKAIESGDLKTAEEKLDNAFSSLYSNGNPNEHQKERIDDTISYYMDNYYWETRFEIVNEK